MAVYTHIGADAFLRFVEAYDLRPPFSYKGIIEGVENTTYQVTAGGESYILTLYERRVRLEELPFFLGLIEHLAARGLPCPRPVRGLDGQITREVAGRTAVLVTFLPGVSPTEPAAEEAGELGRWLARLHQAGEGFPLTRANALSLAGWQELAGKTAAGADTVEPGLARLIQDELEHLADAWPRDLPTGLIHADLFPDNSFFDGARLTGIIDFYFACRDALAYDIAICLNAWCFDAAAGFLPGHAAALLAGYQEVRRLEPAEIAALPVLARGGALRFLLTRLHDKLFPQSDAVARPKDPLAYRRRLSHWRARGAALSGLARS